MNVRIPQYKNIDVKANKWNMNVKFMMVKNL